MWWYWEPGALGGNLVEILVGGFSGGSGGKEDSCNAGDLGSVPGSGRSPGEVHGQRSLVGYSSWGHKELDTTEWLTHTPSWHGVLMVGPSDLISTFTRRATWELPQSLLPSLSFIHSLSASLLTSCPIHHCVWGHSNMRTVCEPRRKVLRMQLASTLILDM